LSSDGAFDKVGFLKQTRAQMDMNKGRLQGKVAVVTGSSRGIGRSEAMLVDLLAQAKQQTDLAAAQEMQQAKKELFASFAKQKQWA
jgi:NADP-dependent 3-hydroxy acid dehydrogenase YdfG